MEIDQYEEGEIKRSPGYSDEGAETTDSLEIKPPQAVVRRHKSSSRRREKNSDRSSERREEKAVKSRHSGSGARNTDENRYREKHTSSSSSGSRHRRHGEVEAVEDKVSRRSDPSKRERESSRHERKDRSINNVDRMLDDLRESNQYSNFGRTSNSQSRMTNRLLDKRRERREDYKTESTTRTREEPRSGGERRERMQEDVRERREMRMPSAEEIAAASRDRRDVRSGEERNSRTMRQHEQEILYQQDIEMLEEQPVQRSGREKRHKRSRKHEKSRDKEHSIEYREKHSREYLQVPEATTYEELEHMQVIVAEQLINLKDPKDMSEQELRRHRILIANQEMERQRENSRTQLHERRMKKRHQSPEIPQPIVDPSVVELSDESMQMIGSKSNSPVSKHSRMSDDEIQRDQSDVSSDSSSSSSSDDDDDDDTNDSKDSNEDSNSDYNNPSPLSMEQLAKSDRSDNESPGHVDTNGAAKEVEAELEVQEPQKTELELVLELPPYLPAIQGCRSVEEYKCLNRIAEGTYGVVYRAEDRRTKEIVALKRLKMEKEKDGFPITSLREINTLLKSQHPNIVTVREIVVGSNMDKIFIVMDYVEHDLKSLMETMKAKGQVFIPGEVKCLMQQLLKAVAHLHDNWILHRDLKTSNLLLSHRGILKVGDFGLAREYGSPLKMYTSIVVTLWYRSPELLLGSKEYSTPIDVWSVGCIFAELLRMEALFPGKSELDLLNRIFKELGTPNERIWPGYNKLPMPKKVAFSQYPVNNIRQRFNLLSDLGIDLLNKFLTYDPSQRVTAEDATKHGYFSETPLAIDPSMFPTWPAKSEFGIRTANQSPKPPSGGKEFKQSGEIDDDVNASGFHMGGREANRQAVGGGFHLKF